MKVVFLVGPTAIGKSQFAFSLAQRVRAEIMNADSVQIYKALDIGSAKPSGEERAAVPHLLFDRVEVGQGFTAGDYRREALALLADRQRAGATSVFVVGGTGFYIQALQRGMYPVPPIPREVRENLAQSLRRQGVHALYQELKRIDPATAVRVAANDQYRILRALEIFLASGQRWSEIVREFRPHPFPYAAVKVGLTLPREVLLARVQRRAQMMLDAGWIDEVKNILQQTDPHWPPLQSVGYREVVAYLSGGVSDQELLQQIVRSTMALAKRQMTWFRRDREIEWFDALSDTAAAQQRILDHLRPE